MEQLTEWGIGRSSGNEAGAAEEQRGKEEAEGIRQGAALKKFGRTS